MGYSTDKLINDKTNTFSWIIEKTLIEWKRINLGTLSNSRPVGLRPRGGWMCGFVYRFRDDGFEGDIFQFQIHGLLEEFNWLMSCLWGEGVGPSGWKTFNLKLIIMTLVIEIKGLTNSRPHFELIKSNLRKRLHPICWPISGYRRCYLVCWGSCSHENIPPMWLSQFTDETHQWINYLRSAKWLKNSGKDYANLIAKQQETL